MYVTHSCLQKSTKKAILFFWMKLGCRPCRTYPALQELVVSEAEVQNIHILLYILKYINAFRAWTIANFVP